MFFRLTVCFKKPDNVLRPPWACSLRRFNVKTIPNKATGSSPIPAYMHPDTARALLRRSQLLNDIRKLSREADRINQQRMEGGAK